MPIISVLKSYQKVTEEVACTSDIENGKYGIGIIHLEYNLNDLSVKKEYGRNSKGYGVLREK